MPSSDLELSDTSEREDLPSQSEVKSHPSSPATGVSYPSVSLPNIQHPIPQLGGNTMGQVPYPYPDPYYRSMFAPYDTQPYVAQTYSAQSMVHLQLMGIQQAGVPIPSDAEEPVFVNAKQYHGILRRRQSRAKAESENKARKSRKTYLHESRHLHALRRARGSGGRFQRKDEKQKEAASKSNS